MTRETQTLILLIGMMGCAFWVVGCLSAGVFGLGCALEGFVGFSIALGIAVAWLIKPGPDGHKNRHNPDEQKAKLPKS